MATFVAIDPSVWRIPDQSDDAVVNYAEIIREIAANCRVIAHRRNRSKKVRGAARVVVTIETTPKLVDLFHNSRAGYRAQYYSSPELGEQANRYAVELLTPIVLRQLHQAHKRSCPLDFVEASLSGLRTKVWIHQGLWLRAAASENCLLYPDHWAACAKRAKGKNTRKKLRWGRLAPTVETRLEIKGTVLSLDGLEVTAAFKRCRGFEIHNFGFT